MSEQIFLFGGNDYNVLSFSCGVADLADLQEFKDITDGYGLSIAEVNHDQFVHGTYQDTYEVSAREIRLLPRLPESKIREFGQTIIILTLLEGYDAGTDVPVSFLDNTHYRSRLIARSDHIDPVPRG